MRTRSSMPAAVIALLALCLSSPIVAQQLPTERIGSDRTILVGIDERFPPYEYVEEGEPKGFNVELLQAVASATGVQLEFRAAPWHEVLAQLTAGEVHMTPTMAYREAREGAVDFSIPVVAAEYTAFVRSDSRARMPRDLMGRRILLQEDGYLHDLLHDHEFDVVLETVPSPLAALQELASGRGDAALLLHAQGLYLLREHAIEGIRTLGPVRNVLYRMAVTDGEHELLAHLNDGLLHVRTTGQYDEIYDQWFGVLTPVPPDLRRIVTLLLAATGLVGIGFGLATAWSLLLRRRVEAGRREQLSLEDQLYQAQKMESLGRLAGSVAHDFNNFLTVILGNLQLARSESPTTPHSEALLGEAARAGESASDLTHHLLSFARGQEGSPRDLTWAEATQQVEPLLRRLAPAQVVIEVHLPDDAWRFHLDPAQASQIVMNLVTNAYEAIAESGVVEIHVSNDVQGGREVVCLRVRDTGQGMDAATRERVFEPFFTTKGAGGAGLGLAGVDRIVTQAGGKVSVESAPGEGATFIVCLPRSPTHSPPEAEAPPGP